MTVLRADDEITHLALAGRLDLPGVQSVELKFLAQAASRRKPCVVDFAGVTFLSSMGVRMLLSAARTLKPAGGARLVILNPDEVVTEAMQAAGLTALIPVARSFDEAAALARGA